MDCLRCPRCQGRAVGKVGMAQWYCWDCCVEFVRTPAGFEVFAMDEEGELVELGLAAMPKGVTACADSAAAS